MIRQDIENTLKKHLDLAKYPDLLEELMTFITVAAIVDLPASTGDSVSDWLRISTLHAPQEQAEKAMLLRVEAALGITPNGRPEWDKLARFLLEMAGRGETIEVFAKNCKLDPYNTPKKHQIAKDPMQIKANWKHVIGLSAPKDYTIGAEYWSEEEALEETVEDVPETAIERAWRFTLSQLETNASLDKWMRETKPLGWENGIFLVGVPTDYAREWLTQRLTNTVQRLLVGILNADVRVEFVLWDEAER